MRLWGAAGVFLHNFTYFCTRNDTERTLHSQLQEHCRGQSAVFRPPELLHRAQRHGQDQCPGCRLFPLRVQEQYHQPGPDGGAAHRRIHGAPGAVRTGGRHAGGHLLRSETRYQEAVPTQQETLQAHRRTHRTDTRHPGVTRRPDAPAGGQRRATPLHGHDPLAMQPTLPRCPGTLQQGTAAAQHPAEDGGGTRPGTPRGVGGGHGPRG